MIPLGDGDAVAPLLTSYREKVFYAFAVAGSLTLLPFSIDNFVHGQIAAGAATMAVVLLFITNAVALALRRSPPIPLLAIALPTIAAIAISVHTQGLVGVFWAYPAVLMFQFMFVQRTANIVNGLLIALVVFFADAAIGGPPTIRVAVTLVLLAMFSNLFASFVDRLRQELETQAIRDPLTGALNRRPLDAHLDEAIERRRRHGVPTSLLALDLDRFKLINDRFGHEVGDLVLRTVVMTIRNRVRRLDQVFRTGGEEFLVILPYTPLKDAALVAESLRAVIARAASRGDHPISVSIGVAEVDPSEDRDSWMRRGDRALYQAKEAGRDRVALSPPPEPVSTP
jgi:diguanylate cyclase (GGDEF)-like protein